MSSDEPRDGPWDDARRRMQAHLLPLIWRDHVSFMRKVGQRDPKHKWRAFVPAALWADDEIAALRAQLAEVTRERDGLRAALARLVHPGIENACDECGGDDSECPPNCAIRAGRKALESKS